MITVYQYLFPFVGCLPFNILLKEMGAFKRCQGVFPVFVNYCETGLLSVLLIDKLVESDSESKKTNQAISLY